jgi:branched-chain amino acid transport system ATP-binding protein
MLMLMQIEQVRVSYGGVKALQGVSLDVPEGEMVGILGGNGAGKTTLVNTICGIVQPIFGDIYFEGQRINGLSPHAIVKLGIVQVPEGRGIFGTLSVLENLKVGAYLQKSGDGIEKSLDQVYKIFPVLKERKNQSGGSLSGGEQQMLAIGRALMANPRLLLMDEPTLGLSPLLRKEVMRITREINQGGTSIILVEQNARLTLGIVHRAVIIQNGQIVMQGSSEELLNNPSLRESYLS